LYVFPHILCQDQEALKARQIVHHRLKTETETEKEIETETEIEIEISSLT